MANGGTVEIDVEIKGAEEVKQEFDAIAQAGKTLANTVAPANDKLSEGLGSMGESIFGLSDSLQELQGGFAAVSAAGGSGFMSLLGPIGAVAAAGYALFETFEALTNSAEKSEIKQKAMSSAAKDLQVKLKTLAEEGVVLASNEMKEFTKVTLLAQVAKKRFQFALDKVTAKTVEFIQAEEKLTKIKERMAYLEKEGLTRSEVIRHFRHKMIDATDQLTKAEERFNKAIEKGLKNEEAAAKKIEDARKKYLEHRATSAEALKIKIQENVQIRKSLELAKAQAVLSDTDFKAKKIEIEQSAALALIQAKRNKDNKAALSIQSKKIQAELSGLDELNITNQQAEYQRRKFAEQEQKRIDEEEKRRRERMKAASKASRSQIEAKKRLDEQERVRMIAENSRITQLELSLEEDSFNKQINLASNKLNTRLALAKDNFNLQKIALLEYQAEVANIEKQAQAKRDADKKLAVENEKAFMRETALFNAQQIENDFIRENELLDLKYQEQLALVDGNKRKEEELLRRYSVEKINLVEDENAKVADSINSLFSKMGQGMAEAAVGAALMGESFKKSIVTVLNSIAKQAGVEALMETAKGIALSLNPATAPQAGAHFTAAGIFTSAALLAKGAGTALGGGGASGGGGVASSAMGSPQSAPVPTRDRAQESEMVFNINFSGAVIYDTKKAAEQALADRVARTMSRRSRGGYRSMQ